MARTTVTTLVDDLDGGPADETLTFAIDGTTYEIDLCVGNATDLRDTLARYVRAGRPVARAKASTTRDRAARSPRTERRAAQGDNTRLRAWARANGWPDLPDRGRIPDAARTAYADATTVAPTGGLA